MLLLPVAFCTPIRKHECGLNIEGDEGANVIMCYNICDRNCSHRLALLFRVETCQDVMPNTTKREFAGSRFITDPTQRIQHWHMHVKMYDRN